MTLDANPMNFAANPLKFAATHIKQGHRLFEASNKTYFLKKKLLAPPLCYHPFYHLYYFLLLF